MHPINIAYHFLPLAAVLRFNSARVILPLKKNVPLAIKVKGRKNPPAGMCIMRDKRFTKE